MSLPLLSLTEISDQYVRKNFERLKDFLRSESPLLGFKHFEVTFTKTETNLKFRHNLGFAPKDILLTSEIGSGSVTFNHSLATAESIDLTISGSVTPQTPYTIRFFAGTYNSGAT